MWCQRCSPTQLVAFVSNEHSQSNLLLSPGFQQGQTLSVVWMCAEWPSNDTQPLKGVVPKEGNLRYFDGRLQKGHIPVTNPYLLHSQVLYRPFVKNFEALVKWTSSFWNQLIPVHNYERVKQLQLLLYSKSIGCIWIDASLF